MYIQSVKETIQYLYDSTHHVYRMSHFIFNS